MKRALEDVRDDADDMSPLTRVAACAALLVYEKYAAIMEESEMYYLAVGKCHLRAVLYNLLTEKYSNVPNTETQVVLG